jgi:hypothetical protein
MKARKKKAQQEVFGFVVIVLLVIVIAIIMLTFSLQRSKRKPMLTEDIKVNDLLSAMMQTTVLCGSEYKKLSELVVMCSSNENCDTNDKSCDKLEKIATEILKASFSALQYGYFRGYNLTFSGGDNIAKINVASGEQSGNLVVGYYLIPTAPGQEGIEAKLYLYYASQQA